MKYQPYIQNRELKQISGDIKNQVKTRKCPFCQTEILQKDKICYACHKRIHNPSKNSPTKKILVNILLIASAFIWTAFCFMGIIKNYEKYRIVDYIIVFLVFLFPFVLYLFVKRLDKKSKEKYKKYYAATQKVDATSDSQQTNTVEEQTQQSSDQVNDTMCSNNDTPLWVSPTEDLSTISQSDYIRDGNTYKRADGKPISDEGIPNLINIGYEQSVKDEKQSTNIKFHRTEKEEELSLQFIMSQHKDFDKNVKEFEDFYHLSAKTDSIDEKIELLEKAAVSFEQAKKYAYRTKGGTIYFHDMYEHLFNSQNEDYSYIDLIKNRLNELIEARDYIIPTLKNELAIHNRTLQKDFYQFVPDIPKYDVQRYIKQFEEEGLIKRTKKGNSYILELL